MTSDENIETAARAIDPIAWQPWTTGDTEDQARRRELSLKRARSAFNAVPRWRLIEEWPDEVYDGRRMQGAFRDPVSGEWCQHVVSWNPYRGGFWQAGGIQVHPTHLAPLPLPPTDTPEERDG
jgi:hypothetical protein